jgi:hypothetical protein
MAILTYETQKMKNIGGPCYMDSQGTLSDTGNLWTMTHTECHWKAKGFTGGIVAFLMDNKGTVIYRTAVEQFGVDGTWTGRPSKRDDTRTYQIDPSIAKEAARLWIWVGKAGKNRSWELIKQVSSFVGDNIDKVIKIVSAA